MAPPSCIQKWGQTRRENIEEGEWVKLDHWRVGGKQADISSGKGQEHLEHYLRCQEIFGQPYI